jgi:glycosyltransferase involved in cell wall biosynthesis
VPAAALPRASEGPVVGLVARLSPEKGVDVLFRALTELPGVTAIVAGEGPARGDLERLADELGLSERVRFLGWRDDVDAVIRSVDVLALPSRNESAPIAIVEAMLGGIPTVASDVGGVPELVLHGETGYLVPPDDPHALAAALRRLLDDPELRARFGARGRELAEERHDPAKSARMFEAIYRELLDG